MTLAITQYSDAFSSCSQISEEDIAEISHLGFKTIINNRPDFEGGVDQPTNQTIQAAAEKAGLSYLYLPVIPGNITDDNVQQCAIFMSGAPTPILGFCRTGMRASSLYQKAMILKSSK